MPNTHDHQASIDALTQQVLDLEQHLELVSCTDALLEQAQVERWSTQSMLTQVMELFEEITGACGVCVHTQDEQGEPLEVHTPQWRAPSNESAQHLQNGLRRAHETHHASTPQGLWVARRLEVSGVELGQAFAHFPAHDVEAKPSVLGRSMELWAEQLDNHLGATIQATIKHKALQSISSALRAPTLDEGLDLALEALQHYVPYDKLALVLRYDDSGAQEFLNSRFKSHAQDHQKTPTKSMWGAFLLGNTTPLREVFEFEDHAKDTAILSADGNVIVGRLMLSLSRPMTPFESDLIERFTDYVRLRVFDFNKEWKRLTRHFAQSTVRTMLQREDYMNAYLSARERKVAVMFCDLSEFTRLSEQILIEPARIARFIDMWSARAVSSIWEYEGVFDKMVGDCLISLWGPPFFEDNPQSLCRRAAQAARQIQEDTLAIQRSGEFPRLNALEEDIGVATGLHFCPLFVGMIGPDEGYTGFSSGMNNTARLQGIANRHEVLCMEEFVQAFGGTEDFGTLTQTVVKNVQAPLAFRKLLI